MKVVSDRLEFSSKGENDMIDLTGDVQRIVERSSIRDGLVTVFVTGSTAAITTTEFESGLLRDFPAMLERIIPKGIQYEHQKRWHDLNGHSHVRASLLGPSLTIPIVDGLMTLGTWQQIVFIELDVRPRSRAVVVQIIGE